MPLSDDMSIEGSMNEEKVQAESDSLKCGANISDEEYWEEMLFTSLGPRGWNIGCGCG